MRYLGCRTYFLYQLYFDDTVNSRVCCERNIKNNLDFLQSKSLLFLTAIFLPSVFCFILQRAHRVKNVEKCSIIPKPYNKAIMQKGESQNGCFKKNKTPNCPENERFLPSDTHILCVSGGKKCSLFGKFGILCFFLKHPFWDSPFCLITVVMWYREVFCDGIFFVFGFNFRYFVKHLSWHFTMLISC